MKTLNEATKKELRELETQLAGLAGYYGLCNFRREREGKRKSPVDQAKYEAFSYAADQVKKLLEEEN